MAEQQKESEAQNVTDEEAQKAFDKNVNRLTEQVKETYKKAFLIYWNSVWQQPRISNG